MRHTLYLLHRIFLALGLLASAPATQAQTPWRLDCPIDTSIAACTQAAADALNAAHPGLAVRTPEHLVISLDNGRKRLVADLEARLQVVALHHKSRFVTVQERLSDGYRWHVISLASGALTRVDGYPLFSPNGKHFLAVQSWTGKSAMPVIARLFEATHPVPAPKWRAACEDDPLWGLKDPVWQSDTHLTFTQTGLPDANSPLGQAAGQVSLQQLATKWVPKGMICSPSR